MAHKSALYCDHANECPQACPCDESCYCKLYTCRPPPRADLLHARVATLTSERDEARANARILTSERDEARANARILAHSYVYDSRPPRHVLDKALTYPSLPVLREPA